MDIASESAVTNNCDVISRPCVMLTGTHSVRIGRAVCRVTGRLCRDCSASAQSSDWGARLQKMFPRLLFGDDVGTGRPTEVWKCGLCRFTWCSLVACATWHETSWLSIAESSGEAQYTAQGGCWPVVSRIMSEKTFSTRVRYRENPWRILGTLSSTPTIARNLRDRFSIAYSHSSNTGKANAGGMASSGHRIYCKKYWWKMTWCGIEWHIPGSAGFPRFVAL